ncbi:UNVERIFIED_CONTAM: hypothetical protein FKN15_049728 [Acipenser sinensis]
MLTMQQLLQSIRPGDWITAVDHKDALAGSPHKCFGAASSLPREICACPYRQHNSGGLDQPPGWPQVTQFSLRGLQAFALGTREPPLTAGNTSARECRVIKSSYSRSATPGRQSGSKSPGPSRRSKSPASGTQTDTYIHRLPGNTVPLKLTCKTKRLKSVVPEWLIQLRRCRWERRMSHTAWMAPVHVRAVQGRTLLGILKGATHCLRRSLGGGWETGRDFFPSLCNSKPYWPDTEHIQSG